MKLVDNATTRRDAMSLCEVVAAEYDALHTLATTWFRHERGDHTLQPTALVHEAFIQVAADRGEGEWARVYLLAAMSRAMRQILVQAARRRATVKRGGDRLRVPLVDVQGRPDMDVLALEDSIDRLAEVHERSSIVATLRLFGGMSFDQIAIAVGVSKRTAQMDWRFARACLAEECE